MTCRWSISRIASPALTQLVDTIACTTNPGIVLHALCSKYAVMRRVRAAEDEHLLHAVAREELQGVLDHRDVHERQEDLRALERDGAEPLRERVREDDRLERDLRLLRVFASVRHRAGWRKGGGVQDQTTRARGADRSRDRRGARARCPERLPTRPDDWRSARLDLAI
jgi:hypothetical protein